MVEMEERFNNNKLKPKTKHTNRLQAYKNLVGQFNAINHSTYQSRQIDIAMRHYRTQAKQVTYSFQDLFDPFTKELATVMDAVNKYSVQKWGTAKSFKKLSPLIKRDWSKIRNKHKKANKSLQIIRAQEQLAMSNVIRTVASSSDEVKKNNLVDHYLRKWKKHFGNKNLAKMIKFFKSDYFKTIPYEDIRSWLLADLLLSVKEIDEGDYFDTLMISMALPFCDYMIVDKHQKNRITKRVKLIKPKGKFNCKILKSTESHLIFDSDN